MKKIILILIILLVIVFFAPSGYLPFKERVDGFKNLAREKIDEVWSAVTKPAGDIDRMVDKIENTASSSPLGLYAVDAAKKLNLIRVFSPLPGARVTSPLTVTGEARGNWYFEASFPVKLLDSRGQILAQKPAAANPPAGGDWMTENFVPFSVALDFQKPTTATGTLVLEKDNPSGLQENADSLNMPVKFE